MILKWNNWLIIQELIITDNDITDKPGENHHNKTIIECKQKIRVKLAKSTVVVNKCRKMKLTHQ